MAGTVTIPIPKLDIKPETTPDRGWKVILFNDDVTPYDLVVFALQRAAGLSIEVAEMVALEAHREAVRDQHKFLERDLEFHRTIASMTSNPIFVAVSQSMFEWMERFHVDQVRAPGAERLTIAEHTRIFKAIAARDPEAAALAMTRHLTRANKLYSVLTRN